MGLKWGNVVIPSVVWKGCFVLREEAGSSEEPDAVVRISLMLSQAGIDRRLERNVQKVEWMGFGD